MEAEMFLVCTTFSKLEIYTEAVLLDKSLLVSLLVRCRLLPEQFWSHAGQELLHLLTAS